MSTNYADMTISELENLIEGLENDIRELWHEFNSFDYWGDEVYASYEREIRILREDIQTAYDELQLKTAE